MMKSQTRRAFIGSLTGAAAAGLAPGQEKRPAEPWYRRARRWGQTNITEKDPVRYDIGWWREYWKRTQVQGVIINAGGIVAYYPSKYPLHHRAEFLNGRDLYGELARAAHEDGLVVLARMDSNRAAEDFYKQHPDWFARDANGAPYRAADKYVTCVNSPYYNEYIPGILSEIIERSSCEGLTDNSWSGLSRDNICYCDNCAQSFRDQKGKAIPKKHNWDDPVYRDWIKWNYARRIAIWELNNRTSKAAGGPDCLWIGMNSGSITNQSRQFRDDKEICKRAEILLLDHQSRSEAGFQQNGETGKLIHGLIGWDKHASESMAMYQAGRPTFRVAAKPAAEARLWMIEGFAGGIQPWWHHVSAYHEDRRAYRTAEPIMRWHKANDEYLHNRRPIATVGVLWSQENTDYYGRERADELVEQPYRGVAEALLRARIPYLPIHADYLERDQARLSLLILPNLAAMSDAQCAAVRRFVERGGGLVATGVTSLYSEEGIKRGDSALADLFGAHSTGKQIGPGGAGQRREAPAGHTYFRLSPELRAKVDGPKAGAEPPVAGARHPVLRGFDETDILPFGGALEVVRPDPGVTIPMTFIPSFPIYPPETAWMRQERSDIPGLILNTAKRRVAYMPADIDRRFGRDNLPDHGDLLANLARWASGGDIPLAVEGRGLLDCYLYKQPGRVILHVVNLISAGTWRAPIDELIPVGPLKIKVKLPADVRGRGLKFLVSGQSHSFTALQGWAEFEIQSVLDHEVVVIGQDV